MGKSRETASRKAMRDAITNSKRIRRIHDKLWNSAAQSPMFCKEAGTDCNGRALRRSARLIGGHAYQIAASGAAAALTREMMGDCQTFGIKYQMKGTKTTVVLPALAKGSKFALEQFCCAYVQEAMLAATRMMSSLGKHKRLNKAVMKAAFEEVNKSIFYASGPAPRATIVVPLKKNASGQKTAPEDEDYVAPAGEGDEAADEAIVAAAADEE